MDKCKIFESGVVLGALNRVKSPCLMHDTPDRVYKIALIMTNN